MAPVISVGKSTVGGLAWSDSSANWLPSTIPTFAVATGLAELSFSATSYTVNRGTYTAGLCIMPAGTGNKFAGDISFAIDGTTFSTFPTSMSAS